MRLIKRDYIKSKWFVKTISGSCVGVKWAYFLTYPLWELTKNKKNFTIYKPKILHYITSEIWWAYSKWCSLMFWAWLYRKHKREDPEGMERKRQYLIQNHR